MRILGSAGSLILVDKGVDDPDAPGWVYDVGLDELLGPMRLGSLVALGEWRNEHRPWSEAEVALLVEKHLPGEHDQQSHAGDGGGAPKGESVRNPPAHVLSRVVGGKLKGPVSQRSIDRATANMREEGVGPEDIEQHLRDFAKTAEEKYPEAFTEGAEWYGTASEVAEGLAEKYGVSYELAAAVLAGTSIRETWGDDYGKELPPSTAKNNQAMAMRVLSTMNGEVPPWPTMTIPAEGERGLNAFLEDQRARFKGLGLPEESYVRVPTGKALKVSEMDPRALAFFHPGLAGILPNGAEQGITAFRKGPEGLSGDKVRSFYSNITGRDDEVTIDSHMARLMHGDIGANDREVNYILKSPGRYTVAANVVRKLAKERGISPSKLQAQLWIAWRKEHPLTARRATFKEREEEKAFEPDVDADVEVVEPEALGTDTAEQIRIVDTWRRMWAKWNGWSIEAFDEDFGPWTSDDEAEMLKYLGPPKKRKDYDPGQERDEYGRWSAGPGAPPGKTLGESGAQQGVKLHFGDTKDWTGSVDIEPQHPSFRKDAKHVEKLATAAVDRAVEMGLTKPAGIRAADVSAFKDPTTLARYDRKSDEVLMNVNHFIKFDAVVNAAIDTGWWSAPDTTGAIVHELAHAAHAKANPSAFARAERDPRTRVMPKADRDAVRGKISGYVDASADTHEFVAEVVSGMAGGRKYDDAVMRLYQKYGGPKLKGMKALLHPIYQKHMPGEHEQQSHAGDGGSAGAREYASRTYGDYASHTVGRNVAAREAVNSYQRYSRELNRALRSGRSHPGASALDAAFEAARPLEQDTMLYRGMTNKRGRLDSFKPGDVYEDNAFVSTSSNERATELFSNRDRDDPSGWLVRIGVPKGTKAIAVGHVTKRAKDEKEMLLPRKARFKVSSIDREKRIMQVEMQA